MDEKTQLTRKPIPKARKPWERERLGIVKLLKKLEEMADDNGAQWVARMKVYNMQRLQDLDNHEPPKPVCDSGSGRKSLAAFRKR